ncbi:MAG: S8 family peptidase [Moraxellaceae bacterium]|nr:S8 family peptidase [Moraxellaceae bacterium]
MALAFIPEEKRLDFLGKIDAYLDPRKDKRGKPKNQPLIDSIAEIRLADIRSFWTDDPATFPANPDQAVWWELWLKKDQSSKPAETVAQELAQRLEARLGNASLSFFDSYVILINTSAQKLSQAPELIGSLEELRRAKETPTVLIESSTADQAQWAEELIARLTVAPNVQTAVAILDSGINYNHPLLSPACNTAFSESWLPGWPHFDAPTGQFNDHGSRQAGLALYGDLYSAQLSTGPVEVAHILESGRILPPLGANDPELYGAITVGTAYKLETARPDLKRTYSLAVTASLPSAEGGLPSSWSAEIDQFTFGLEDELQRLFVVSAGNNRAISPTLDIWDQAHNAQIEDPAQAWNVITVGAYTEKTTNDDATFQGWSPFSMAGDIAPATRSSLSWRWANQAPYKPEIVMEGGNRLLSPDHDEITTADVVSLLTTSGRTTGQLFETTADTSAACAQTAHIAATLMSEYPSYWPETIRGLLVHSAEWTSRMWERFGLLNRQHSAKRSKEIMLRTVGYGVPDTARARYSASHLLTLIAQNSLQPFTKAPNKPASDDPTLHEMHLHQLPWPLASLRALPPELEVKLKVTLSYFIEPNPGRRGYRQRYSYQSHALRFDVIRPGQSLQNFRALINGRVEVDDYTGPEGDNDGWHLGPQLRKRGCLHSDTWIGTAADLADMHTIAVYPVGGWWKFRTAQNRWQKSVRYSLIVSIDVPDEDIDIYSEVETRVAIPIII